MELPRRKKGKGAAPRIEPLTPDGIAAFKAFDRSNVWGKKYSASSIHKSWCVARAKVEKAAKKKGKRIDLSGVRPYDLRHTFGTDLSLVTDGNVATIAHMLGHATLAQAERYRMAAVPTHLREAAAKLARARQTSNQTSNRPVPKRAKTRRTMPRRNSKT